MKKIIGAAACGLLLVGCATQRPQMDEATYTSFSRGWAVVHQCYSLNHIDVDMAAHARRQVNATMNRYEYDPAKITTQANWFIRYGNPPSQEDCQKLALVVRTKQQQIAESNAIMLNWLVYKTPMIMIPIISSAMARVVKKTLRPTGTEELINDSTARLKAISVAVGIAQPPAVATLCGNTE